MAIAEPRLLKKLPTIVPIIASLTGDSPFFIDDPIPKTSTAPITDPIIDTKIRLPFESPG